MTTHDITITLQDPVETGMHFLADTGDGIHVAIDSDASVGGQDLGVRPQKLMLAGLAACTAMDVISILRKKRQTITGFEVRVTAEKATEHPKVYTSIHITYILTGEDVDPAAVDRAIELSMEKYCPVANMLKHVVPITTEVELKAGTPA